MKHLRTGIALVEVMLAIVIATALVSALGITVARMLRSNHAAQEHLQTVTNLGRFGEQFRRDAHSASNVLINELENDDRQLVLNHGDDRTIIYQIIPGGIERTQSEGDQLRQRERFLLPGMRPLAWNFEADRQQVALSIGKLAHPSIEDDAVCAQFSILAVLRNVGTPTTP